MSIAEERDRIVAILEEHIDVPYAAQNWTSIYDIVYLRENEGRWRFAHAVDDLAGERFFALTNANFTNKSSDFFVSVNEYCVPLDEFAHFGLFDCGQLFWENFPK